MTVPSTVLTSLRASTTALLRWLDAAQWSDADVRAPSLLPGWTRGHVLTHVARNADGIALTLAAALRGEIVPRYPHGTAGRNADIEAGAGRSFEALVADVRDSAERLDGVFATLVDADPAVWGRTADDRPAGDYPAARWREVEIHWMDLGGDYTPRHWPAEFVDYLLPEEADQLSGRVTGGALRIEVTPEASTTDLGGRVWTVGDPAAATRVTGPDWAILAWLIGRPGPVQDALSAVPPLPAWR